MGFGGSDDEAVVGAGEQQRPDSDDKRLHSAITAEALQMALAR